MFFNVMHHVATDGWSRAVLHQDLTELYDAALERREPRLDPLRIQYADYAVWHRDWLDGGVLDQQLDHWKERSARRAVAARAADRQAAAGRPSATWAITRAACSRWICGSGWRRSPARAEATLFMVLLAAYAALLHRYSGQDDIVIGTPFAGRNRSELEAMIGYFINPLALRIDVSGDPSFDELLARAQADDARGIRACRRPVRDGRPGYDPGARPEPDAGLPGDDGAAQPRLGAEAPEVRAERRRRRRSSCTRRDGRSSTSCSA